MAVTLDAKNMLRRTIIVISHCFHVSCNIGSWSHDDINSVSFVKIILIIICKLAVMGNCLSASSSEDVIRKPLPIDTVFKLASPLPNWPAGGEFASGVIDIGGLQLKQVSSFSKIWETFEGGPDNLGATFFEPSPLPDGFSMLGTYAQPNNRPLFGWVLVGKTDASDQSGKILKNPTDYTLQANVTNIENNVSAYFWLPIPPDGFRALGYIVTTSQNKPELNKIHCVRSDFTDELERDNLIWSQGVMNGLNVYGIRPRTRGTNAQALSVNTYLISTTQNINSGDEDIINSNTLPLSCLRNNNPISSTLPNLEQVRALYNAYSPLIYFHPSENYLPSSVNWYFSNGALLYQKGDESNPKRVEPDGSNLPQGGSNDGSYWLDLPNDDEGKEKIKRGDVNTAESYVHVKPILGSTFTDIQVWIFYPFNGPSTAKVGIIDRIRLGKIGEHVGDWEHITLRISNLDGILYRVYFAQHGGGAWVDAPLLEFREGSNKFAAYSSLNGHASFDREGSFLQGGFDVGIRNDTKKGDRVMDCGERFDVVAVENPTPMVMAEPPWLNYARLWGPTKSYEIGDEVEKIRKILPPGNLRDAFDKLVDLLPDEVYGQQGPTGPKMKNSWNGDEKD